jgi:hypothetical protein
MCHNPLVSFVGIEAVCLSRVAHWDSARKGCKAQPPVGIRVSVKQSRTRRRVADNIAARQLVSKPHNLVIGSAYQMELSTTRFPERFGRRAIALRRFLQGLKLRRIVCRRGSDRSSSLLSTSVERTIDAGLQLTAVVSFTRVARRELISATHKDLARRIVRVFDEGKRIEREGEAP